jgi:Ni/Co efflux regulator RcnB
VRSQVFGLNKETETFRMISRFVFLPTVVVCLIMAQESVAMAVDASRTLHGLVRIEIKSSGKAKQTSKETGRKNQHGSQGTGNFKSKRDRHQKPGPMHEKKRWKPGWKPKR